MVFQSIKPDSWNVKHDLDYKVQTFRGLLLPSSSLNTSEISRKYIFEMFQIHII